MSLVVDWFSLDSCSPIQESNNRYTQEAAMSKKEPITVGFVGLGHMGSAMAANLASAGYRVTAYVRHSDRMTTLAELGLKPTIEVVDLFNCDIVISMVPDDPAVRDLVFGRKDL